MIIFGVCQSRFSMCGHVSLNWENPAQPVPWDYKTTRRSWCTNAVIFCADGKKMELYSDANIRSHHTRAPFITFIHKLQYHHHLMKDSLHAKEEQQFSRAHVYNMIVEFTPLGFKVSRHSKPSFCHKCLYIWKYIKKQLRFPKVCQLKSTHKLIFIIFIGAELKGTGHPKN